MDAKAASDRTTVERASDRELVVTRTFNGPARIVFKAWTTPDLFKRWWVPKSSGMSMLSCEMDIRTVGLRVFRVLELIKTVPDKMFSGAIVNYPDNIEGPGKRQLMLKVIDAIRELHRLLNITKDFHKPDEELSSYDIAHHVCLSIEQEYELLGLLREEQRQEYIKRHLGAVLPVIAEMETLKERVKLNGHFKNLSSFKFED